MCISHPELYLLLCKVMGVFRAVYNSPILIDAFFAHHMALCALGPCFQHSRRHAIACFVRRTFFYLAVSAVFTVKSCVRGVCSDNNVWHASANVESRARAWARFAI